MDKPKYYIASLSGGKDSTAMVLRLVEEHYPLDEVLFCDTGVEFDALYAAIDKAEEAIGRRVTRLHGKDSFEHLLSRQTLNRPRSDLTWKVVKPWADRQAVAGRGYGWPGPFTRWCTRELKLDVIDKHLTKLRRDYEVFQYIGLACDEQKRLARENAQGAGKLFPLNDWKMTEADCLKYCYDRGFDFGRLYDYFDRTGCYCCPLKSMANFRMLWKHFKPEWARLRKLDEQQWRFFAGNPTRWFTVAELEFRFRLEEAFQAVGKSPRGREFFTALDNGIARLRLKQI